MKITEEMVDYVSALSRLSLPEEERAAMGRELERILQYMDILAGVDTAGVEPMSHIMPLKNVMREDRVLPSTSRSELLAGSPGSSGETFLVPKAVE